MQDNIATLLRTKCTQNNSRSILHTQFSDQTVIKKNFVFKRLSLLSLREQSRYNYHDKRKGCRNEKKIFSHKTSFYYSIVVVSCCLVALLLIHLLYNVVIFFHFFVSKGDEISIPSIIISIVKLFIPLLLGVHGIGQNGCRERDLLISKLQKRI